LLTRRTKRLTLPHDRPLLVGVVADTHGRPHPNATQVLRAEGAAQLDAILHGGDVGDLAVLDALAEVAPVIAVRGNIDGAESALPDLVELEIDDDGATALRILLTHIAVYGPKLRAEVVREAQRIDASIVVCGHSHVPFLGRDRGITMFNPGSIGPRRFTLPITLGMMRIVRDGVSLWHIDCETGQRWRP